MTISVTWISAVFAIVFLITWNFAKEKRNQRLIICIGLCTGIECFIEAVVYSVPWQRRFCRSNAVSLDASDGVTYCSMQVFAEIYFGLSAALCWMFNAIDLFLRVVLERRSTREMEPFFFATIFIGPLPSVIYLAWSKKFGYAFGTPSCWIQIQNNPNLDFYLWFIPIYVMTGIGIFAMGCVMYVILKSTIRTSGNADFSQQLKALRTPILFVLSFLVFFLSLVGYRVTYFNESKRVLEAYESWVQCVFSHYDGSSDSSWLSSCGAHSSYRIGFGLTAWSFFCISAQASLTAVVHLSSPTVLRLWARWLHIDALAELICGGGRAGSHAGGSAKYLAHATTHKQSVVVPVTAIKVLETDQR